jgi:hypothetical protein
MDDRMEMGNAQPDAGSTVSCVPTLGAACWFCPFPNRSAPLGRFCSSATSGSKRQAQTRFSGSSQTRHLLFSPRSTTA